MSKENLKVVKLQRNLDVQELLQTAIDSLKDETDLPTGAVVIIAYDHKGMEGIDSFSTNMPFSRQIGLLETAKLELFITAEEE